MGGQNVYPGISNHYFNVEFSSKKFWQSAQIRSPAAKNSFFDFSKAFNTIPYEIVLNNLSLQLYLDSLKLFKVMIENNFTTFKLKDIQTKKPVFLKRGITRFYFKSFYVCAWNKFINSRFM